MMGDMFRETSRLRGRVQFESNMDTHHIDYASIGNERFGDLIVICRGCHDELHEFIGKMAAKGFDRRRTMERLKPYATRKLLAIHRIFDEAKHEAMMKEITQ